MKKRIMVVCIIAALLFTSTCTAFAEEATQKQVQIETDTDNEMEKGEAEAEADKKQVVNPVTEDAEEVQPEEVFIPEEQDTKKDANLSENRTDSEEETEENLAEAEDVKRLATDSFAGAKQITLGSTINDSITENVTKRYYKFTLASAGEVSWRFVDIDGIDVYFYIYDVDGKEVDRYRGYKTEDFSIDLIKGTYYLLVDKYSGTGSYSLKTGFASANESYSGDNGDIRTANTITLGSIVYGQIAKNRNQDNYKFTISSAGRVSWRFVNIDGKVVYFFIYDVDGKEVDRYSGYKTEDFSIDLIKGTYYLQVIAQNSLSTGAYTLKTSFKSAGESYTGDNGTIKQANNITLGKTIKGHLAKNRISDFYKFTLPFTGNLNLRYVDIGSKVVYFYIYDVDGKEVDRYNAYKTEDFSIDLIKGTYYLQVIAQNSLSTGAYTLKTSFKIGSLNNASVSLSTSRYTYNGRAKTPTVTVKRGGKKLVVGKDYQVTYKNNKVPGKASVVIKGIGYYEGSVVKTFTIRPKGTSLSSVSAKSRSFMVKWKKQTTPISGYQIQYAANSKFTSGKKTITVSGKKYGSKKVSGLQSKKRYYVRVRTYRTVSGIRYYSAWSKAKTVKTRR